MRRIQCLSIAVASSILGLAPGAACVMQQHQREQALDLAAAGHQAIEQARQPNRFTRKIRPHQIFA